MYAYFSRSKSTKEKASLSEKQNYYTKGTKVAKIKSTFSLQK